jgi:hypothetical protein
MTNSRAKGARGEREAARAVAQTLKCTARRGQQFSGSPDSPDIKTSIPGIHFEVKRTERGNVHQWMAQAVGDAGAQVPVVLHRKNNEPWLLIVRLEDADVFARQIVEALAAASSEELGRGAVPGDVSGEGVPPTGVKDDGAPGLL